MANIEDRSLSNFFEQSIGDLRPHAVLDAVHGQSEATIRTFVKTFLPNAESSDVNNAAAILQRRLSAINRDKIPEAGLEKIVQGAIRGAAEVLIKNGTSRRN